MKGVEHTQDGPALHRVCATLLHDVRTELDQGVQHVVGALGDVHDLQLPTHQQPPCTIHVVWAQHPQQLVHTLIHDLREGTD